ncbi:hypothetical protein JCM3770_005324 [Rhodotorula araucariae]
MLLSLGLIALTFAALVHATATILDLSTNASVILTLLDSTRFDYVVVGGGTAGLAVASRIAAGNSSSQVLVLEAGGDGRSDAKLRVPGLAGWAIGTEYDWGFSTTPQKEAASRSVYWPRGKVLGGSSAVNFLLSTRPNPVEHDVWASLAGSISWSWNSLLPFYKKAERFFAPGPNTENEVQTFTASLHGNTGPIAVSYAPYMAPTYRGFFQALRSLGHPVATDVHSGNNVGVNYAPSTINPYDHSRSYSAEYLHLAHNVVVVLHAQVTIINWGAGMRAKGVSFVPTGGGDIWTADAVREVILSAGAVQTPQLLELSGVGNPAVLNPLGISTVINLPGVGENLQDHPAIIAVFRLHLGAAPSLPQPSDPSALAAAFKEYAAGQGILTQAASPLAFLRGRDFLNSTELNIASTLGNLSNNPQLNDEQYAASVRLSAPNVPAIELVSFNAYLGNGTAERGYNYVSLGGCLQHSLSRGSIHITSPSPFTPPAIDPNYLQSDLDTFLLVKAGQYLRHVAAQPALAQFIASEAEPGPAVQSEADWEEWVRSTVKSEFHPLGTASMMPRSSGGVVGPDLRVHGTSNVRVVDMSVVPIHVSSHLQTVAYAIAEKAASLILSDQ